MQRRIGLVGADGTLGRRVLGALGHRGVEVLALDPRHAPLGGARTSTPVAVAVAAPWGAAALLPDAVPAAGVALRTATDGAPGSSTTATVAPRLAHTGWFGGLGSLLAARALAAAAEPGALHVAHALLPSFGRAWQHLPTGLRTDAVDVLLGEGRARVGGELVAEPAGEGRRLAWFPRPVGPWHAAAVPGVAASVFDHVPEVRTWLALGSLGAELLQAGARLDPAGRPARSLRRRADAGGTGATGELRWGVVAEVRDHDGTVQRAWANGTDPVWATAELLAATTLRLADGATASSLHGLAPATEQLDALADTGALRWSIASPTPSPR